jgi:formamidopyrimidine-DNA glycosylase
VRRSGATSKVTDRAASGAELEAHGAMPELPQMQALAERLDSILRGHAFRRYEPLSFHALKTARPAPEEFIGEVVRSVDRRAKYLVFHFDGGRRMLMHLSQAGRLDIEAPPKKTKPKGAAVRLEFAPDDGSPVAVLVREYGTERKAGWWLLADGDDGPLAKLGPEPDSEEFEQMLRTSTDGRRIHTLLRDQATVAGIGRGYSDDVLHRARLSPYATLKSLDAHQRDELIAAIKHVLADGLERERRRAGGLSEAKLGEHFTVHGKAGVPCPECGTDLRRVSYESHEVVYCPQCQTGGKVLADRRTSRFLK